MFVFSADSPASSSRPISSRADWLLYVSGVIDLDGTRGAGAGMLANITDCEQKTVRIGNRMRVSSGGVGYSLALPRFEPLPGGWVV